VQATHKTMRSVVVCACFLITAISSRVHAQDAPQFGARARVKEPPREPTQPTEAESVALQEDLGTSFSLAESLPGSLPVFSGVPYLIVRGATPAGTATYYDSILIPSLFHIALGPSIVNPHLLGQSTFYPGVGRARFGRHVGGTLVADAPTGARAERGQRELELTLLDASGYLYAPEINTAFAWRVGDPGLLMNLLGLDATLNYFDYQIRHESTIGSNTRLVLLGLGAGDELGDRTAPSDDISLTFQRWVARITQRFEHAEFGSQLSLGYDVSTLGQELQGNDFRIEPSLYFEQRAQTTRLRIGADMLAMHVNLRRRPGAAPSESSLLSRSESFSLDPQDFLDGQPYASLPTRNNAGLYAELAFEPLSRLQVELGLRADTWLSGSASEFALSPSARLSFALTPEIELHGAIGLSHQSRGSPVPLPSLSDVSIDAGLEKALQAEIGASLKLPEELQLEAAYFHHRYFDTVYLELILDCGGNTDPQAAQGPLTGRSLTSICRGRGLPTASGDTQGVELYLKRNLTERISGFVSYTLAFADAVARDGTPFTPQSDVRHLVNAVLHWDLGSGFAVGVRLHYRSGKMAVNTLFNVPTDRFEHVEKRLPSFFRADLRGSYSWNVSFGRMEASIGVQNLTASSEATKRDCMIDPFAEFSGTQIPVVCVIDYQRAIVLPNLGIRAEM
jgi:outer membrane receptor protein involved in Fe transport